MCSVCCHLLAHAQWPNFEISDCSVTICIPTIVCLPFYLSVSLQQFLWRYWGDIHELVSTYLNNMSTTRILSQRKRHICTNATLDIPGNQRRIHLIPYLYGIWCKRNLVLELEIRVSVYRIIITIRLYKAINQLHRDVKQHSLK